MLGHLRERLRAYHAERNATFIVIEHQMEFVMTLCTRVLVLAEGRIIAQGAPADIRRDPLVIEAVAAQSNLHLIERISCEAV